MKKNSKKKTASRDRKITHTFDNGLTVTAGPTILKKIDEANKSLKGINK